MISTVPATGDLLIRSTSTPPGDRLQRTDIVCLISPAAETLAIRYCCHETYERARPGRPWKKIRTFQMEQGGVLTHQARLAVLQELSFALWETAVVPAKGEEVPG